MIPEVKLTTLIEEVKNQYNAEIPDFIDELNWSGERLFYFNTEAIEDYKVCEAANEGPFYTQALLVASILSDVFPHEEHVYIA